MACSSKPASQAWFTGREELTRFFGPPSQLFSFILMFITFMHSLCEVHKGNAKFRSYVYMFVCSCVLFLKPLTDFDEIWYELTVKVVGHILFCTVNHFR
jgi:hypothetical protein